MTLTNMKAILPSLLTTILLTALACINPGEGETIDDEERVPDQVVTDYVIKQMNDNKLEWELHSQKASIYNKENTAYIETVKIYFFDKVKDEVSSTLTSDRGEVNTQTNDMIAKGHVVIRTNDGAILLTDRLRWDNKDKKIRSDDEVWLKRGRTLIHGFGFESDPELKSFRTNRASGDVTPDDLKVFSDMEKESEQKENTPEGKTSEQKKPDETKNSNKSTPTKPIKDQKP